MNSLDAAQQQSLLMFDGAGWRPRRSWIHAPLLDARDVVRTYAMTLDAHNWTSLRDRADFTPLHFHKAYRQLLCRRQCPSPPAGKQAMTASVGARTLTSPAPGSRQPPT